MGLGLKALGNAEQNYCVTRKELFAVVAACRAWHQYIYGRPVVVRTDNSAVACAKRIKKPVNQMARWLQELGTYDFHEVHRPGRIHWNADALSRRPHAPCSQCHREDGPCSQYEGEDTGQSKLTCAVITRAQARADSAEVELESPNNQVIPSGEDQGWSSAEIRGEQLCDPDITKVMRALDSGSSRPEWQDMAAESESAKTLWARFKRLTLIDGVLFRSWENDTGTESKWQLVVPKTRINYVLGQVHDAPLGGHLGGDKMLSKIQDFYYWVNMRRDIREYCRRCDQCTARKPVLHRRRAPMQKFVVGSPMERVTTDIMGPLDKTTSGNKYILVVTDVFTKWTEAYAISNIEARTVAKKIVEEWVCRYGAPRVLHSDQGRQYESSLFREMCKLLGIKKTHTTALRPQANGQVERFNRTLGALLAIYSQEAPNKWDKHLPFILAAYRAAKHDTTGQTPNAMVLGRDVVLPLHLVTGNPNAKNWAVDPDDYVTQVRQVYEKAFEMARHCLKKAANLRKKRYDMGTKEFKFAVGQQVWLHDPTKNEGTCMKLRSSWRKGWVVTHCLDDVTYRIQNGPNKVPRVVHADRLLPYKGRDTTWWAEAEN